MNPQSASSSYKEEILVADDNEPDLKRLAAILKEAGYRVRSAGNGPMVLRTVKTKTPDLILLDMNLSGMNGVEVCRKLKANPQTEHIAVLFIIALSETDLKGQALQAGAADYITKPVEPLEVIARVDTHIKIHRLRERLKTQQQALRTEIEERQQAETTLQQRTHELGERAKQLNCLYGLAQVLETEDVAFEDILQSVLALIPPAWQHTEITCARIVLNGNEYKTGNFGTTSWRQKADIRVYGQTAGFIEVAYTEARAFGAQGPFLEEERFLLNALAERLGGIIESKQAEKKIKQQKVFLETVIESLAHPFFVINVNDYSIELANSATMHLDFTEPRTCYNVTHQRSEPCDGINHPCPLKEIRKTKKPFMCEHVHFDVNKNRKIFEVHAFPIFDDKNNVVKIIEYSIDITERKRVEESLKKSEERFFQAFKFANIGVGILDTEGRIIQVNNQMCEIFGYSPKEFEGMDVNDITHPDYLDISPAFFRGAVDGEVTHAEFEKQYLHKNGNIVWGKVAIKLIRDNQGRPLHFVSHVSDITASKRAEEALRESQTNLIRAQAMALVGSWELDRKTMKVTGSDELFRMFGINRDEAHFEAFIEVLHPDDREYTVAHIQRGIEHGEAYDIEHRLILKDGTQKWMHSMGEPVKDESGQVLFLSGITQDITKQKQAEKALQESEARLHRFMESATDGFILFDAKFNCLMINKATLCTLGLKRDDVIGESILDVILNLRETGRYDQYKRVIETGEPFFIYDRVHHPTLGRKHLEVKAFKVGDGLGIIFTDISERMRTEDSLKESEDRYHGIFEYSKSGVAVYSAVNNAEDFIFVDYNGAAEKIDHIKRDDLIGKRLTEIFPRVKEFGLFNVIRRVWSTGEPEAHPVRLYQDDRIKGWRENFVYRLPSGEIVAIFSDETERQQSKKRLEIQRKQLIQADKMVALGTLVAGVAHEINNPNNFIAINTPMVKKAWQSIIPILEDHYAATDDFDVAGIPFSLMRNRAPQLLEGIAEGSRRIKKIVTDLKRFAQPTAPDVTYPVDINAVIKSAMILVGNMVKKATQNCSVDYGLNIPLIDGNYQHLEQVVINLIQNACQALEDQGRCLFIRSWYDDENRTVKIEVRDQGVGIPKASLSKVMDPFYTTRRETGGTGLGLSVSCAIVKEHGGQITAESEMGSGSIFTVSLPPKNNDPAKIRRC